MVEERGQLLLRSRPEPGPAKPLHWRFSRTLRGRPGPGPPAPAEVPRRLGWAPINTSPGRSRGESTLPQFSSCRSSLFSISRLRFVVFFFLLGAAVPSHVLERWTGRVGAPLFDVGQTAQ